MLRPICIEQAKPWIEFGAQCRQTPLATHSQLSSCMLMSFSITFTCNSCIFIGNFIYWIGAHLLHYSTLTLYSIHSRIFHVSSFFVTFACDISYFIRYDAFSPTRVDRKRRDIEREKSTYVSICLLFGTRQSISNTFDAVQAAPTIEQLWGRCRRPCNERLFHHGNRQSYFSFG